MNGSFKNKLKNEGKDALQKLGAHAKMSGQLQFTVTGQKRGIFDRWS